jgi:hypothetical protein
MFAIRKADDEGKNEREVQKDRRHDDVSERVYGAEAPEERHKRMLM